MLLPLLFLQGLGLGFLLLLPVVMRLCVVWVEVKGREMERG